MSFLPVTTANLPAEGARKIGQASLLGGNAENRVLDHANLGTRAQAFAKFGKPGDVETAMVNHQEERRCVQRSGTRRR